MAFIRINVASSPQFASLQTCTDYYQNFALNYDQHSYLNTFFEIWQPIPKGSLHYAAKQKKDSKILP